MKPRSSGDAEIQMPLKNRTILRKKGCWNCKHWDNQDKAKKRWESRRIGDLMVAKNISLALAKEGGENHPSVVGIRRMVAGLDDAIARGIQGVCLIDASESHFVADGHLCHRWDGRDGWSLADGEGASDALPEELKDKIDGSDG